MISEIYFGGMLVIFCIFCFLYGIFGKKEDYDEAKINCFGIIVISSLLWPFALPILIIILLGTLLFKSGRKVKDILNLN